MKILIDTHAFLWSIDGDSRLSNHAAATFESVENELLFSAASYWEICLKISIKKLELKKNWQRMIDRQLSANAVKWLTIEKAHLQKILSLPWNHRDPFDRLLIAQAQCERCAILTNDTLIASYDVKTVW